MSLRTYWWALQNALDPAGADRRSTIRLNRAVDNLAVALAWYGKATRDMRPALRALDWIVAQLHERAEAAALAAKLREAGEG